MPGNISVSELLVRGVALRAHEAVAIARALIHSDPRVVDPALPVGPPSLSTVRLSEHGTVSCGSCGITPSVSEVAILLSTMLRQSATKAGGGLRYAIARALLHVDAPPFESVADFSRALQRHEQGETAAVVRELWTRANRYGDPSEARPFRGPERRQTKTSVTELRRQLREADRRIYELLTAEAGAPVPPTAARPFRRWMKRAMLGSLALIVATGLMIGLRPLLPTDVAADAVLTPIGVDNSLAASETPEPTALPPPNDDRESPRPVSAGPRSLGTDAAQPPEATSVVRALNDDSPTFSPSFASNGTAMFFHTGRTQDPRSPLISVDDVAAAKPVAEDLRIFTILEDGARNYHVRPSPDGTRIAFDSDRDGDRGVYLAESDGTNVRRVSGPGYAAVPTWSPGSDRLALVRGEPDRPSVWNLWLHTLSTGEMVRVTSFRFGQTWGASWFPDGRRVCYSHEDRLFVYDLETGRSQHYPSPVPGRLVRTPAVSPDGQRVIFQVARHGAWLLDLSDRSMRVVIRDPTAEEFAWSPDGRRVAFHSKRDGGWGIWFTAGS